MYFDMIAYSNELQEAGMTKKLADAVARGQQRNFEAMLRERELATKADLTKAKADIIAWMAGLVIGLGAFLAAVMALLR